MNILAHLFLSGKDPEIIFGNFIGDYVKGKKIELYPEKISEGIRLHREIDHFTDGHKNVKKTNKFYRDKYGKHAGIVTDIVFDYFLHHNWNRFSDQGIDEFIKEKHNTLNSFINRFPRKVAEFYPFFIMNNWLKMYSSLSGIERVLKGMAKRTSLPKEHDYAIAKVEAHFKEIDALFLEFFADIIEHIQNKFEITLMS